MTSWSSEQDIMQTSGRLSPLLLWRQTPRKNMGPDSKRHHTPRKNIRPDRKWHHTPCEQTGVKHYHPATSLAGSNNEWAKRHIHTATSSCTLWINIFAWSIYVVSGGSRISPRRGRQLPRGGANIRFCQIFQKTAWNWKNLDPQGGTLPKFYYVDPPLVVFVTFALHLFC